MWRHLTSGHVIEENRHQNNVKAHINNEMFQRSLNLSNRTFKIDAKILDLLRRFKAGLVKVSASIRGPIRAVVGPFNEPSNIIVYSKTCLKWPLKNSCTYIWHRKTFPN